MDVPESWTGPSGHVLDEPWMQNFFRDDLAVLIRDLEVSGVPGLAGKRTFFRTGGLIDKSSEKSRRLPRSVRQAQATTTVLEQRAELLVGAQLAKAGVLTRMRADTPDFEGRWGSDEFGVEVTTRARSDVAQALHDVLEEGLRDGPEVLVTLGRTGKLLTAEPETIAEAGAWVIAEIARQVGAANGEPGSPVPDLELSADLVWPSPIQAVPGLSRVTFQPVAGETWTDHHWKMAALMIKDKIEKDKALKTTRCPASWCWTSLGWVRPAGCRSVCGTSRSCSPVRRRRPRRRNSKPCWMDARWAISAACWSCGLSWACRQSSRCAGAAKCHRR